MSAIPLLQTEMIAVTRSKLRQNQSAQLKRARGQKVLLITSNDPEEEKVVLDRQYYEELRKKLESVQETLEIAMDRRLFNQILAVAGTLEDDLSLGKLHSLEDAFAED